MKKIWSLFTVVILLQTVLHAQDTKVSKDTTIRKAAISICNCLEKKEVDKAATEAEMQEIFLQCIFDSAATVMGEALLAEDGDMEENGEAFGEKIALEMMNMGCAPFIQMSLKLAKEGLDEEDTKPAFKNAEGIVLKAEEKEFLYITIKTTAGREITLLYMDYVDGSDNWVKDAAAKLKDKNVSVQWIETEIYQPKLKDFANIKTLRKLEIK